MSGDDQLGRFLRGEVPEPKAGYWEEIDARLQAVEAERRAAAGDPEPGSEQGLRVVAGGKSDSVQTDEEVVRLTNMRNPQNDARPRRNLAPILAAAAVVVIAAIGGVIALNRSDATEIEVGGPGTTDGTSSDGSPPVDAEIYPVRRCYTDDPVLVVADFTDARTFTGYFRTPVSVARIAGTAVDDSGPAFTVRSLFAGAAEEAGDPVIEEGWTLTADGFILADGSLVSESSCDDSAAEVEEAETFLAAVSPPVADTATSNACFASGDSVLVVNFRTATGFVGAMTHRGSTFAVLGEATGEGSAYRVLVSDFGTDVVATTDGETALEEWFLETRAMFLADDSVLDAASCDDVSSQVDDLFAVLSRVGYPDLSRIEEIFTESTSRACLADDAGRVAAFDFVGDGDVFTGIYLGLDGVEALSAARISPPESGFSDYLVAREFLGSGENRDGSVVEEIWLLTEDGVVLDDGTSLIVVGCDEVASDIDPAFAIVGDDRPPVPTIGPLIADTPFTCYSTGIDGEGDLIGFDESLRGATLSGVLLQGDSVRAFNGVPLGPETDDGTDYLVAVQAIGSGEDGEPQVVVETWSAGTDATMFTGDRTGFGLTPCSEVSADLQAAFDPSVVSGPRHPRPEAQPAVRPPASSRGQRQRGSRR